MARLCPGRNRLGTASDAGRLGKAVPSVRFVFDTNAVSELRKARPNSHFYSWVNDQDPACLFVTTISLAEVWHGFHLLRPDHVDYENIKRFASILPRIYSVLNFDQRAAATWGEVTASARAPLPLRDSFIGAIARSRGYRVVTRDVAPFERMGCKVLSPWR